MDQLHAGIQDPGEQWHLPNCSFRFRISNEKQTRTNTLHMLEPVAQKKNLTFKMDYMPIIFLSAKLSFQCLKKIGEKSQDT